MQRGQHGSVNFVTVAPQKLCATVILSPFCTDAPMLWLSDPPTLGS